MADTQQQMLATKSDLAALKTDFDCRFDLLLLELRRLSAQLKNSFLKNPTLRINSVPGFDLQTGIVYPDSKLFPRNARDFYALRNPSTNPQRQVLEYLRSFYDLTRDPEHGGSSESDDDEANVSADSPEYTVDELEAILGLNEDNFIRFQERAKDFGARGSAATGKHPHTAPEACGARQRQRVEAGGQPLSKSGSSDKAGFMWGDRSTPSSQRPTINELPRGHATIPIHHQSHPPQAPSDSASPTNAVSTPPGFAAAN